MDTRFGEFRFDSATRRLLGRPNCRCPRRRSERQPAYRAPAPGLKRNYSNYSGPPFRLGRKSAASSARSDGLEITPERTIHPHGSARRYAFVRPRSTCGRPLRQARRRRRLAGGRNGGTPLAQGEIVIVAIPMHRPPMCAASVFSGRGRRRRGRDSRRAGGIHVTSSLGGRSDTNPVARAVRA
jgi:hypothetical protein